MTTSRSYIPFVFRSAHRTDRKDWRTTDSIVGEDPLPERLEIKEGRLALALATIITRVQRETTDDN